MEQNIIKNTIFTLLLIVFTLPGFGQNFFIPEQWWVQKPLLNPAASGLSGKLDAAMGSRLGGFQSQFEGILSYARVDGRIDGLNSGIGFSYFNNNPEYLFAKDSNFVMRQRLAFNYNYQFTFSENSILSLGIVLDIERVAWQIDGHPANPVNPAIPPQASAGNDFNLGFGIFYQSRFWQTGVSLVPSVNLKNEVNLNTPNPKFHILASGHYPFENDLAIAGGVLVSLQEDTHHIINLNTKIWLANAYYAGIAVTSQKNYPDSFDLLLGLSLLNSFQVHYTYSIGISDLANINANRHIISLQYRIAKS